MIAILAIMTTMKKKSEAYRNRNCCNYGNSVNDIIDFWCALLLQFWQFWLKKSKGILMDAIVAIMAVLKILLIPNDRNCCNYGNFGKK